MEQLERLQFEDPEIIKLRRFPSAEIAELNSELPGPIELPGCGMAAPFPDPHSCVYELSTIDNLHGLQEEYLTTPDITQSRGSEIEPPCSDLEPLGAPNASSSGTLRNVDREDERQSVFTDLETLVKALPARTSWQNILAGRDVFCQTT